MADDDEILPAGGNKDSGRPVNKKAAKLVLVGAIALGAIYAYNNFFDDAQPRKQEQKTAEKNAADDKDKAIDVSRPDERAYVLEFDKRLDSMAQIAEANKKALEAYTDSTNRKLQEFENDIDLKLGKLVEEQTKFMNEQQEALRYGSTTTGLPPLPGAQPGPTESAKRAASPIEYVAFGNAAARPQGDKTPSLPKMVDDAKAAVNQQINNGDAPSNQASAPATATPVAATSAPKKTKMQVPAASFVHVTLLHGVDCPVGDQAAMVVLPVMGTINGPNGSIADLGNAHLLAKCVGLSNTERGRFVVERISYVGASGEQQNVKVEGYIVDRRDSGQDVRGVYDSKQGAALAKTVLASSIAALGNLAQLAQTTTTVSGVTGGASSALTGDIGRAATGAAIKGAADRTANYYQTQLERLIPVVHVEAGLPLDSVFTAPFELSDIEGSSYALVD